MKFRLISYLHEKCHSIQIVVKGWKTCCSSFNKLCFNRVRAIARIPLSSGWRVHRDYPRCNKPLCKAVFWLQVSRNNVLHSVRLFSIGSIWRWESACYSCEHISW